MVNYWLVKESFHHQPQPLSCSPLQLQHVTGTWSTKGTKLPPHQGWILDMITAQALLYCSKVILQVVGLREPWICLGLAVDNNHRVGYLLNHRLIFQFESMLTGSIFGLEKATEAFVVDPRPSLRTWQTAFGFSGFCDDFLPLIVSAVSKLMFGLSPTRRKVTVTFSCHD